jgi:hypothetical protein
LTGIAQILADRSAEKTAHAVRPLFVALLAALAKDVVARDQTTAPAV